jgi:phage host-nuclease inhibitor protein Gam
MAKTVPNPVPGHIAGDDAAAAAVARIGAIERALAAIETRKARMTARVQAAAEHQATPLQAERQALFGQLEDYCDRARPRLTDNYRTKSVEFPTGICGWRETRGRVVIDPVQKRTILAALKKRFADFVRVKEEIDAQAIGIALRKDPKAPVGKVPGISLEPPRDAFYVTPAGAELAERPASP